LRGKLAGDTRCSPVQGGSHLEVGIGLFVRLSLHVCARLRQEIILQKSVDHLGNLLRAPGTRHAPGASGTESGKESAAGRKQ
jgi:hypothetical protein